VSRGEIELVIIFSPADAKMRELFPIIDECRKSKVSAVLLSEGRL
jgi:hypothetical protein